MTTPEKSQKEKMLAGELYIANDPQLYEDHLRAQDLLHAFNHSGAREEGKRLELLRELLGHLGEGAMLKPTVRCDYGYNISVGDRSFINYDSLLLDCNRIEIGSDVQIAPGVHIYTATHPVDPPTRISGLEYALPVVIENSVWLGGRSVICPGVTIGENSVIGAGSVVTRSIPANVVAVGNPCRVIRNI